MYLQHREEYVKMQNLLLELDNPSLQHVVDILQPYKSFFDKFNIKLILASEKANIINYNEIASKIFNEHSFHMFQSDKFLFIDKNVFKNPNMDIGNMYGIFLDTNITSCINNKEQKYIEMMQYIKENINYRYIHIQYTIENIVNSSNIEEFLEATKITYQKWYEFDRYEDNEVSDTRYDDFMAYIKRTFDAQKKCYKINLSIFYISILKSIIINKNKNLSAQEKMKQYSEFINTELCRLHAISSVFAHLLFNKKQLKIFDKLNVSDIDKVIKNAKNTAMDLIFINIKNKFYGDFIHQYTNCSDAFFIPFFNTDDNGIKEFTQYVKWRGLLKINDEFMPLYPLDPQCYLQDMCQDSDFSAEAFKKRQLQEVDFDKLAKEVELELFNCFKNKTT